ncbi:MAG: hypothetical protein KJN71_03655 [Acidimicrobiia bacterium]|nr:hypothetical protein [Acidimicrobiia bacterium]NNF65057.1 hypothetical protein [Acidimicrobiia bacterium]
MSALEHDDGFSMPVVIWIIAMIILLLGGVSVDLWRVLGEYRTVAGVVDGASIAGATAVDLDQLRSNPGQPPVLDVDVAFDRACNYLVEHASVSSCFSTDVAIMPTASSVTVTVTRDVDLTLLQGLNAFSGPTDTSPIRVTASGTSSVLRGLP